MQERPEVPELVTLVGESVHVRPVEGDIVPVREIEPLKPLSLVSVMVEVPVDPARSVAVVGLAVTVKS